jgi:hypothetical protein
VFCLIFYKFMQIFLRSEGRLLAEAEGDLYKYMDIKGIWIVCSNSMGLDSGAGTNSRTTLAGTTGSGNGQSTGRIGVSRASEKISSYDRKALHLVFSHV